eukprot:TRINITY_DN18062_c0_g1_i1.p4 TRINITY_DN18062_c0_g1~~TRINITY_DN18062_c0_g1_i1.p4  ORF type:complete len:346 (+),score=38.82 TRINITY_DN18062_c0_g1_i1:78-1040(+)
MVRVVEDMKENLMKESLSVSNLRLVVEGAHGDLYQAVDRESRKGVMLKAVSTYCGKSIDQEYMFSMREIILHSTLPPHPNIVPCNKIVEDNQRQMSYIVMPQMEGDLFTLARGIKFSSEGKRTLMPEQFFQSIMKGILQGLAHIHDQGFLHGDLKPENVLWGKGGQIKLCDFAMSRHIGAVAHRGDIMGTVRFRPPEFLMESFRFYDASFDMWAVGCILAELVFGQRLMPAPFSERKDHEFLAVCQVLGKPPRGLFPCMDETDIFIPDFKCQIGSFLEATRREVSKECIDLMLSLLSFDPQLRPSAQQALKHGWFGTGEV